jgi:hypothetical protein
LSCDRVCRSEEDSHREVELDETGGREWERQWIRGGGSSARFGFRMNDCWQDRSKLLQSSVVGRRTDLHKLFLGRVKGANRGFRGQGRPSAFSLDLEAFNGSRFAREEWKRFRPNFQKSDAKTSRSNR